MGTADVEVLYDKDLMPLRIWKRMTLPGLPDAGEKADIRRYELRTDDIAEPELLTQTQIEGVPGSQDDALRAARIIPGIASNLSTRPYIRGSFVDDVLVQFDGVPLADPFHLKNFQSLASAFDPAAVKRIQVYSGGFPVSYGTRSGGVIDVEPRSLDAGYEHAFGASLNAVDAASRSCVT